MKSDKGYKYSKEEHIGATGVHEGTHATDPQSNKVLNPKSKREDREKHPVKNVEKHKQELDEQKDSKKIVEEVIFPIDYSHMIH